MSGVDEFDVRAAGLGAAIDLARAGVTVEEVLADADRFAGWLRVSSEPAEAPLRRGTLAVDPDGDLWVYWPVPGFHGDWLSLWSLLRRGAYERLSGEVIAEFGTRVWAPAKDVTS